MLDDPAVNLYEPIPHGQGQTILREIQLVADHNAYHTGEFAILRQVMDRASMWLAPLLALSANSPFWLGEDTGYASFRTLMWSRWPTSGQPQHFSSLDEYNALLQALIATGSIEDATKIYWDIRLSERFNTIEFRVTDCC
ncbi:MAG: carboxylate-amine ligase, partial [Chloroflexi bacterium]